MKTEDATTIRIELKGRILGQFKTLKDYYGLNRNTNIVRTLINERYEKLHEAHTRIIPVTRELYSSLEIVAEMQGLTVDQLVERICLRQMRQVEQKASA